MRFQILGQLRVWIGDDEVILPGGRDRIVLATLLLSLGCVVPVPALVDAVWGDRPPRDARNQVQGCVSRLRKRLDAAGAPGPVIRTESTGYRTAVDPSAVDLGRFRRLCEDAHAAVAAGQSLEADQRYRAALELWRGPALAALDSVQLRRMAVALDEERVQATVECLEVELGLGRADELVPELTDLVRQHPYHERLHEALMLALYRAGRQGDALAAYREAARLLREDLGAEPGSDLQKLHRAILSRDPGLAVPPAPVPVLAAAPVPRELPAQVPAFTGRQEVLKALDDTLVDAGQRGPVVISAIAGTAGVGKTALAVQWAHQVADRFPDGQLYMNLRGYAAGPPARPIEALAAMLRSLGVPPEQIPSTEAQAAGLYRSRLAGRRVLVVLDNASSVEQVRPLLPGSAGALVLVTSRDRLSGLVARDGARRITLDVLTRDEAHELLGRLLGAERVEADPDATAALAEACACLPLALRVAAANLPDQWPIAEYVAQLTSGDRLARLAADGDQASAVRATFDLSYQRLPTDAQRLFRLLGLAPGPDFTPPAAAALAGVTHAAAGALLARLARGHLINERSPGRYAFHDLLRRYASGLAEVEEHNDHRVDAVARLLDWYLRCCDSAAGLLYPQMLRLPAPPLDSSLHPVELDHSGAALAWLDAERSNLVAAIQSAADHGPRPLAWRLADCLRGYFWYVWHTVDWLTVAHAGARAATREGDLQAQAAARLGLATAYNSLTRHAEAIAHLAVAVEAAEKAGWSDGHASALGNLGIAHWHQGQLSEADAYCERAVEVNRTSGGASGEANNSLNLGLIKQELGRLGRARACTVHALVIARQLGYRLSEAIALLNLGGIDRDLGRLDQAHTHYTQALAVVREVGDRHGEAVAIDGLASVDSDLGNLTSALSQAQTGVEMLVGVGDRPGEAVARTTLGAVYLRLGSPRRAAEQHQQALDLARRTGNRRPEIQALIGLATVAAATGEYRGAASQVQHALDLARETGHRVQEGRALTLVAGIRCDQGDLAAARDCAERALDNHRETGHRLGEASTLAVLGRIQRATGDPRTPACWLAARSLFAQIGAPVPEDLI